MLIYLCHDVDSYIAGGCGSIINPLSPSDTHNNSTFSQIPRIRCRYTRTDVGGGAEVVLLPRLRALYYYF